MKKQVNFGNQYLTKSLFSLGLDCPTKMYYSKNRAYANRNSENDFLKALADGGFQVGALAQCMFPEGILIGTLDKERALQETTTLLERPKVTIFEAAISFENLLIRADVLVKEGNNLSLFEVKSNADWNCL